MSSGLCQFCFDQRLLSHVDEQGNESERRCAACQPTRRRDPKLDPEALAERCVAEAFDGPLFPRRRA
jgi:hypothetical protein